MIYHFNSFFCKNESTPLLQSSVARALAFSRAANSSASLRLRVCTSPIKLFVVASDNKRLLRIDKKTGAQKELAGGFGRILDIVGDGDRVAIADQEKETISAVPMTGSPSGWPG